MSLLKPTLFRQRLRMGKENIIILGLIAFLVMSFWSLYSMSFNMQGNMADCPFINDSASFCQMSIFEHINQWQQMFVATRGKSLLSSLFILLVVSLVALFKVNTKIYDKLKSQRFRDYFYQHKPEIRFFDYLLLAFSRGIIHPKIYI